MSLNTLKLFFIVLFVTASAGAHQNDDELVAVDGVFRLHGVENATLVVSSVDNESNYVYNKVRSEERFTPASTFKLLNTLIGLSTGAVSDNSLFYWDGTKRAINSWNANQTLESAFKVSCVWCYQEIARKVGSTTYRETLAQIHFGNEIIGDEVDTFWLDGSLTISALEQVEFLRKLFLYDLPFSEANIDTLRTIMLVEEQTDYSLYGKTGLGMRVSERVGWYVGFLETPKGPWLFAMNMRVEQNNQVAQRREITLEALTALGLFDGM